MTLQREAEAEVFGLAGTFPRPGWVVLDAARDHRFTGELVFDLIPEIRVYLDRGQIYLAERAHDPSLGARLVDAGAISSVQRENGGMVVGDGEYLGRLFERVPSVDRHAVLITTEMMNDECVSWLARQQVRDVTAVPYQRHVSGLHRWEMSPDVSTLMPGDPLPAPSITARPAQLTQAGPILSEVTSFADGMIEWDEPSWLDDRTTPLIDATPVVEETAAPTSPEPLTTDPDQNLSADWVDRLDDVGLPEPGDDPLSAPASLPARAGLPATPFEIIWPSGDVDENFGAMARAERDHHPDHDRAGPTVRIGGSEPAEVPAPAPAVWEFESAAAAPSDPVVEAPVGPYDMPDAADGTTIEVSAPTDSTNDVVLAVRRAIASIETGSLDARRRLAANPAMITVSNVAVPVDRPGGSLIPSSRSVFDDEPAEPSSAAPVAITEPPAEPERVSALRRLIGGLRRR